MYEVNARHGEFNGFDPDLTKALTDVANAARHPRAFQHWEGQFDQGCAQGTHVAWDDETFTQHIRIIIPAPPISFRGEASIAATSTKELTRLRRALTDAGVRVEVASTSQPLNHPYPVFPGAGECAMEVWMVSNDSQH